jgi:hypothetical protein
MDGPLIWTSETERLVPPEAHTARRTARSMTERYASALVGCSIAADRRKRRSKFAPSEAVSNERAPAGTPFYGSYQVAAYRAAVGHTERPGLWWA